VVGVNEETGEKFTNVADHDALKVIHLHLSLSDAI